MERGKLAQKILLGEDIPTQPCREEEMQTLDVELVAVAAAPGEAQMWRKQKIHFALAGDSSLSEGQSMLQHISSERCLSSSIPGLLGKHRPALGRQLLETHPAAHGVQDWTPHCSRQDFHSWERKICLINPTVTKTKGLFLCNHLSVVSVLMLQHLHCVGFFFFFFVV